jgi:hypothetical protein
VDTSFATVPNAAAITDGIGAWNPNKTTNLDKPMKIPERQAGAREYGSSALYDNGKIIWTAGGNDVVNDKDVKVIQNDGPPTNQTEIIDLNKSPGEWQRSADMNIPRRHHNATTPTGRHRSRDWWHARPWVLEPPRWNACSHSGAVEP